MRNLFPILLFCLLGPMAHSEQPVLLREVNFPWGEIIRAVSSDFRYAAIELSPSGRLAVMDLQVGREVLAHPPLGANQAIYGTPEEFTAVAFSPDSQTLVVGREDGVLESVDIQNGRVDSYQLFQRAVTAINLVAPPMETSAQMLVTTDKASSLWWYPSLIFIGGFPANEPIVSPAQALHPDGYLAAFARGPIMKATVALYDFKTGRETLDGSRPFYSPNDPFYPAQTHLPNYSKAKHVTHLRFVPNRGTVGALMTGPYEDCSWAEVDPLRPGHPTHILAAGKFYQYNAEQPDAFSGDGNTVLFLDLTKTCAQLALNFPNLKTDHFALQNSNVLKPIRSYALSHDGKLALLLNDAGIELWRLP